MAGGAELGVYGLAAMGANLARNAARSGLHVAVFNRTTEKTTDFVDRYGDEGRFTAADTIEDFVGALASPRVVLLMIEAGSAIDDIVGQLRPLLAPGDIVIDAGNSLHSETDRRVGEAAVHGLAFVGMGVSGGEKGALEGPSLMVGGDPAAYQHLKPILTKMAAKVGDRPCRAHFGPGAAGH